MAYDINLRAHLAKSSALPAVQQSGDAVAANTPLYPKPISPRKVPADVTGAYARPIRITNAGGASRTPAKSPKTSINRLAVYSMVALSVGIIILNGSLWMRANKSHTKIVETDPVESTARIDKLPKDNPSNESLEVASEDLAKHINLSDQQKDELKRFRFDHSPDLGPPAGTSGEKRPIADAAEKSGSSPSIDSAGTLTTASTIHAASIDSTAETLASARLAFREAMTKFNDEADKYFERRLKEAWKTRNASIIRRVEKDFDAFTNGSDPPKNAVALRRKLDAARAEMRDAYEGAIAEYDQHSSADKANHLRKEFAAFTYYYLDEPEAIRSRADRYSDIPVERIVLTTKYFVDNNLKQTIRFNSNRHLANANGPTWFYDGKTMLIRWPSAKVAGPDYYSIELLQLSPDGKTFHGSETKNLPIRHEIQSGVVGDLIPRGEDARINWTTSNGTLRFKNDADSWYEYETADDTNAKSYYEVTRNAYFVEIQAKESDLFIRIYDGHAKKRQNGAWKHLPRSGQWVNP